MVSSGQGVETFAKVGEFDHIGYSEVFIGFVRLGFDNRARMLVDFLAKSFKVQEAKRAALIDVVPNWEHLPRNQGKISYPNKSRLMRFLNFQGKLMIHPLGAVALVVSMGATAEVFSNTSGNDRYANLDTDRYLGEVRREVELSGDPIFTEGPAVDREGRVFFTNIRKNEIFIWDAPMRRLTTFTRESQATNGLRFTPEGDLIACQGGLGRLIRFDGQTGEMTVLAERFGGKRLQSPNDTDYDRHGRIYFSSRTGNVDMDTTNKKSLYRADPDGSIHQLLTEPEIHMPNGVVVSPDGNTLYVIEADGGDERNRNILAFDLAEDGSISNRRVLIDLYPGRSGDGMCIDVVGNLYVAAGLHDRRGTSETLDTRPGIHVISPKGEILAFRETPLDTITNCTFGGPDLRTLYVTCGPYLLSIRTEISGKPSYLPSKTSPGLR